MNLKGGSDKKKAQELQQLFAFIKESAMTLANSSTFIGKHKLKTELQTHAHLMTKTLNTIEQYAKPE